MLKSNFKTILIVLLLLNNCNVLTCDLENTPNSGLNLYQVLGCATDNNLKQFNSQTKTEILKIAFNRASEFAVTNPSWGPMVKKAIHTLSHPDKRHSYNQDLIATTISKLIENISEDLDNSDADQLLQDLIALNKLPDGNNIIMNLTEDPKRLDYDYLRARLLTDADRVIEYINSNIFGY